MSSESSRELIHWLLDSDPSIRWQVMRDLTDTPAETTAAERARVASVGWGRQLLELQRPDGQWGDGVATPFWWSNLYTLVFLRDNGYGTIEVEYVPPVTRMPLTTLISV